MMSLLEIGYIQLTLHALCLIPITSHAARPRLQVLPSSRMYAEVNPEISQLSVPHAVPPSVVILLAAANRRVGLPRRSFACGP
jgi:hypothetical protein